MGFAVVNVTYRLARVAPAPAAVEDCLCALRWIAENAKEYGFDLSRLAVTGYSAGGHLVTWLGSLENRDAVARRVSPLTYVRKELPPVLTIHGDADPVVPYAHGTRLQAALQSAGATSELMTIPKGLHGNFPRAEQLRAIQAVRAFVVKHGVLPTPATSSPTATSSQ
jgi:acetyl esterase/lipase